MRKPSRCSSARGGVRSSASGPVTRMVNTAYAGSSTQRTSNSPMGFEDGLNLYFQRGNSLTSGEDLVRCPPARC